MDSKMSWIVSIVAVIALAAVSIVFLGKEQMVMQNTVGSATQHNCTMSGGTFTNNACSCEEEYDTTTGYCMTAFGIPGGEMGAMEQKLQEMEMMKNTEKPATPTANTSAATLASAAKIVAYNCTVSGGTYRNNTCACKDATYEANTGHCVTAFGTAGGELGEMEKKLQELEMLKNR